jgi:predicted ATPase
VPHYVYESVSSWTVYHFHDTSPLAQMRRDQPLRDWNRFRHDASNIAPFLLNLRDDEPGSYELIRDTVRLIAPFFDDFLLRPQTKGHDEQVRLEWQQKGSDFPFQPNHLSDGTIRFVCLATALLQPELPATVVIDEPELGLHPYAISMLADLIKSASERTQVIISTQSPTLLDYFEPEEVVVVNRKQGRSTFERLDADKLKAWLEDYSVGELWQKNVVQGGPTSE